MIRLTIILFVTCVLHIARAEPNDSAPIDTVGIPQVQKFIEDLAGAISQHIARLPAPYSSKSGDVVFRPEVDGSNLVRVHKNGNRFEIIFPLGTYALAESLALATLNQGKIVAASDVQCVRNYFQYIITFDNVTPGTQMRFPDLINVWALRRCPDVASLLTAYRNDPANASALYRSVTMIMSITMLHEWGHIIFGHLDMPPSKANELAADSFAFENLMYLYQEDYKQIVVQSMVMFPLLTGQAFHSGGSELPSADERIANSVEAIYAYYNDQRDEKGWNEFAEFTRTASKYFSEKLGIPDPWNKK